MASTDGAETANDRISQLVHEIPLDIQPYGVEAETENDRISQLVQLLAQERQFTSIEIAETLWLALHIEPVAEVVREKSADVEEEPADSDIASGQDWERENLDSDPLPPPLPPPPSRANITTPIPKAGVLPPETLPVWLADPAVLSDPLAVIRALKPLLQQVEMGQGRRLDESATVDRIARTRLWLPILAPERKPWFDILLVVDRGSSMQIWHRLVQDLVGILRRYGAFRDLQVFNLEVDRTPKNPKDKVLLRTHPDRPGHHPSEVIDQRGRRIAIVLSDCAGQYWWDGTLWPMLHQWSTTMPTVVWQMLPEWMWERTALGRGTAVALSNDRPGAANQQLIVRTLERGEQEESLHRLPMPVVTSEVRDLTNWSLMLAGDRREVTPGFLLPQHGGSVPKVRTIEEIARDRVERNFDPEEHEDWEAAIQAEIETIARARVERFRELSSPHARRLVMLLAAAPVITLPVMRLIRDSMLYESKSPLPIAEVFLSGLLQRLPGQEEIEPDLVQYDFVPKVREALLEVLPTVDTIEVINSVSAAVEKQWNKVSNQNFRAFLTNPQIQAPEGLEGLRAFASVTATILEQLGGEYASFARQLRQGTGEEPLPNPPEPEEVVFPELEPFEFIDAQLVVEVEVFEEEFFEEESSFALLLQTEEFTVITVQWQPDAEEEPEEPELNSFTFTVATLQPLQVKSRQATEWRIQRQRSQAYRFLELLPDEIFLEMVSIPGGTFMMGSPEGEPGRSERESPQHEVAVPRFFMARCPVTQAQWLTVAAMPPVQRSLDPEPSNFKGSNRPVECVSWYDAIEFCERLSVHTGRTYRLPTEAEWEYACRAGTTTPFHFGEMITTEVANYNGNHSYNGGTEGVRRGETTPINQFGDSNAFGLSDMHGNVWEWCQDHWHDNYEGAPIDGSAWLTEEQEEVRRILRGGSWSHSPRYCRSAYRFLNPPNDCGDTFGFRVVCCVWIE